MVTVIFRVVAVNIYAANATFFFGFNATLESR